MKTDKQLYKFFQLIPEFLFELTSISSSAKYEFTSETIKEFSRSMDGLMKPDIPGEPHYVVEFQMQKDPNIYYRTIMEMAALGSHNEKNIYYGIIIFRDRTVLCQNEPWTSIFQNNSPALRLFYLDELIETLKERNPAHPMLLVFYPYLEKNDAELEKNAASCYNKLKQSDLPDELITGLVDIFISWLVIRFKNKSHKEALKMLALTTPFEETRFYKDIVAIGKEEGEKKGEKKIAFKMFKQNYKPEEIYNLTGISIEELKAHSKITM